jgi:two-component system, OmpR family, KDP operon response regulator KdpE
MSAPLPAGCILVVDDEPEIRRAVKSALRNTADEVLEASTVAEGIDLAAARRPELVILDLGLPDGDGAIVCQRIREFSTVPIIVLTVRHADREKVRLLDLGADDFVTKPFSLRELDARVRSQLRRAKLVVSGHPDLIVRVLHIEVDLGRRRVSRDGGRIALTPIEWSLLRALVEERGRTLTHRQLFDQVWGQHFGDAKQLLRFHVTNLRRKIERDPADPRIVITEPGVGYRDRKSVV